MSENDTECRPLDGDGDGESDGDGPVSAGPVFDTASPLPISSVQEKPGIATSAASIGWLVALAMVIVLGARQWLVTTPYFALRSLRVEGASHRSRDHYAAHGDLVLGRNVLAIDLADVRRKLLAEPWVEEALVVRRLPGSIDVTVREREPAAVIALDEPYLVTASGNIFKAVEAEELVDRPVITGLTAEDLADAVGHGRELLRRALDLAAEFERGPLGDAMPLQEVHVERSGEMLLRVGTQGVALELGQGPYRHKLDVAAKVIAEVERRGGKPTALLLDGAGTSERVVVRAR